MPTPIVGKTKWKKYIRRGLRASKRQFDTISRTRADVAAILVEGGTNAGVTDSLLRVKALLDELAKQTTEHIETYLALWDIGDPLGLETPDDE